MVILVGLSWVVLLGLADLGHLESGKLLWAGAGWFVVASAGTAGMSETSPLIDSHYPSG